MTADIKSGDKKPPSQVTPQQARAERLAEQLRANLAKRKAQMRERKTGANSSENDDH